MTRLDLEKYRYLSLTSVAMRVDQARDYLVPKLNQLKASVFSEDPDVPICLHRSDIRHRKGPFEPLKNDETRILFDERLLTIMRDAEYSVISVLVDKLELNDKHHWERTHPYHVLMEVIVEKHAKFLVRKNSLGDIMPEARGKHQDNALQTEFAHFKSEGTRFASRELISDRIPSRNLKFRTKKDFIAGLQLCDMLAHPSHYTIRRSLKHDVHTGVFGKKVCQVLIGQKYDRSPHGRIWGYGAKSLP